MDMESKQGAPWIVMGIMVILGVLGDCLSLVADSVWREPRVRVLVDATYDITGADVGDLNGDGHADVLICDGKRLLMFLAGEGGRLSQQASLVYPVKAWDVLIADFDADHCQDFVVGTYHSSAFFYFGKNAWKVPLVTNDWCDQWQPDFLLVRSDAVKTAWDLMAGQTHRRMFDNGVIKTTYLVPPKGIKSGKRAPSVYDLDGDGHMDFIYVVPRHVMVFYGPLPTANGYTKPESVGKFTLISCDFDVGALVVLPGNAQEMPALLVENQSEQSTMIIRQDRFEGFNVPQVDAFLPHGGSMALLKTGSNEPVVTVATGRELFLYDERGKTLIGKVEHEGGQKIYDIMIRPQLDRHGNHKLFCRGLRRVTEVVFPKEP